MMIPTPEPPAPWHPDQAPLIMDQALVQQYINTSSGSCAAGPSRCRRVELDSYLDRVVEGYVRQKCEAGEIACDRCEPDWEAHEPVIIAEPSPIPSKDDPVMVETEEEEEEEEDGVMSDEIDDFPKQGSVA